MATKSKKPPVATKRALPKATPKTVQKAAAKPMPAKPIAKPARAKVPFSKKNQPPSEAEFLARLPLATGKKFEAVRTFARKQKGVAEDLYYYGPKTGWAYRYARGGQSLATIMIHDGYLMGIVALDAAALAEVDFAALSEVGQQARKMAHGTPALLWLDLPLDGPGASDFKALLKAKVKALPPPGPPPPPPPPASRQQPPRRPLRA